MAISKHREPCNLCAGTGYRFLYRGTGARQVMTQVDCTRCKGKGEIAAGARNAHTPTVKPKAKANGRKSAALVDLQGSKQLVRFAQRLPGYTPARAAMARQIQAARYDAAGATKVMRKLITTAAREIGGHDPGQTVTPEEAFNAGTRAHAAAGLRDAAERQIQAAPPGGLSVRPGSPLAQELARLPPGTPVGYTRKR